MQHDDLNCSKQVPAEALDNYREHGFALLSNVVPPEVIELAWQVIDPWVDSVIENWREQGLIDHDFKSCSRWERLRDAWRAAGEPHFRRQPYKYLIVPSMYHLMRNKALCDLAAEFIGTRNLSIHGVFNARPQLPSIDPTHLTPFHQDAQYWYLDMYGKEPDLERRTHVMTMWIPLREVDETSGALQVISTKETGNVMFAPHDYDELRSGMVGLSPAELENLTPIAVPMSVGDALVFNQRTPHGANSILSEKLRWAIDIRFEATEGRTIIGRRFGFIVQSIDAPETETPLEEWLSQVAN
jgi:phytanoyl-CoA hydroxylase